MLLASLQEQALVELNLPHGASSVLTNSTSKWRLIQAHWLLQASGGCQDAH
jgi:hypothetical protein